MMKSQIVKKYLGFVKKETKLPTYADLLKLNVSRDMIRRNFGNLESLHNAVSEDHKDELHELVAHADYVFSKIRMRELSKDLKHYKRFFITTAVTGKSVDKNFYKSIQKYCEANEAKLLLLPSADVHATASRVNWIFDPLIKEETFVHSDVKLNDNVFISSIKLIAKQINPTTGLSRIGQRNGSYIFASPKQFLEYIATSPGEDKYPHAMMTPGAITKNEYNNVRYMNDRTAYIAKSDHVMGGIIVEIESRRTFHYRQVQADSSGSFIDLGVRYSPNSTNVVSSTFVMGDWHAGSTDPTIYTKMEEIVKKTNAKNLIVHDLFDGFTISPHEHALPLRKAIRHTSGFKSLKEEIKRGGDDLLWMASLIPDDGKIIVVKSNHDEWLERWLNNSNYVNDPVNHQIGLDLSLKMYDNNVNILQYAYEKYGNIDKIKKKIVWLDRDQTYKVGGVECGQHGDKGANGAKGSLMSLERAYGDCVVGHNHAPAILRGVWRVGTFTKLKLHYNKGPSSWAHTGCSVYPNGSKQLISLMRGKWFL